MKQSILLLGDEYMDWIKRLNSAVNYMEENIKETIDLEEVSKIACCSTYHFQRMFTYIADIEVYLNADLENAQYEVQIPISKKEN